ncbi:MAG: family 16 glycoside hydrolase [Kiritimatiellia bacterium]
MNKWILLAGMLPGLAGAAMPPELTTETGTRTACGENARNFVLTGAFRTEAGAAASLAFHADGAGGGYEVLFRNGPIDGTRKTGSLAHVRNLYRSLAADGAWCPFEVAVRGACVTVRVGDETVVRYVEPENPWRAPAHMRQRLGRGDFVFAGEAGRVAFRDLALRALADDVQTPADAPAPIDEQTDRAIRKQQIDFPVIDFHVHLKGGLTKEMAHRMSLNYGINYGVAPNVGEGGVGRMLRSDAEARAYLDEVKPLPFLCGAQGEGRKWPYEFSKEMLAQFDYLFTDSMTIVDDGVPLRIYRPEEFRLNGRTDDEWMDFLVSQIEKILTNEPADIYANATYLPPRLAKDYDAWWTDARIARVLDVLEKNKIALEISARYKIPSAKIIRRAKARGIKFTFGTNNADADFGRLEYALDMVDACGLTAADIWFPKDSVRARRAFIPYNVFRK